MKEGDERQREVKRAKSLHARFESSTFESLLKFVVIIPHFRLILHPQGEKPYVL